MLSEKPSNSRMHLSHELKLLWFIFIVGLIPIIAILVRGGIWGTEPSLGMLFVLFGGYGIVTHYKSVSWHSHQNRKQ